MRPASTKSIDMRKPVYGFGINDADYVVCPSVNGRQVFCPYYQDWLSMLKRVGDPDRSGTGISAEWRRFSNFRRWVESQPEGKWYELTLDKDIIVPGNTIYSAPTCCYVPEWINTLMQTGNGWSQQVDEGRRKPYRVKIRVRGESLHVGYFATEDEARRAYCLRKAEALETSLPSLWQQPKVVAGMKIHIEILKEEARR